ncbi:hypothetical protein KQX64_23280 [Rhodopseudomonas palustris]|nr:hypothetical protein KQX64_23280 [Rhodopseudomonas palustris]
MKFTGDMARRITGISAPFGGLQWADPGPSESELVRRFIVFLEDRRVLFNPMQLEIARQVECSIDDIRAECTKLLQSLSDRSFASVPIRAIREASRHFKDARTEQFWHFRDFSPRHDAGPGFFVALGAYRAIVGQQVALLSAHYDVDIEGDLTAVLPTVEAQ